MTDKLYVISVVFNPVRYKSRYALYQKFEAYVKAAGATLVTVEVALGDRPFMVTKPNEEFHVQLRTTDELWVKESAANVGISRLPYGPKCIALVDADVTFERTDWVEETIQQLQHYDVVQMFSHAIDLGPNHELIQTHAGFCYSHLTRKPFGKQYTFWHPGYAWAWRSSAFEAVGGFLDFCILGSADHHMAGSLLGKADATIPGNLTGSYRDLIYRWQERAAAHVKRNIGYVPGLLRHGWHGKKADRKYEDRWNILTRNKYDPHFDIKKDSQMLVALTNRNIQLRDDIRHYFRVRNEDSIDL